MTSTTSIDKNRYARHLSLPEIGLSGQEKLQNSRILCIGAGGLGATVLYYLAAAGIGTLGIIDGDTIDLSNLQRQILYTTKDINQFKVKVAKKRLLALNPWLTIHTYPVFITANNALALTSNYDVIVDATDNHSARYLINDACSAPKTPVVFAGILRFKGQCSIFNTEHGPCYRCLYPNPPQAHLIPNCAEAGVLGVLPGLLGCLQANETIKLLLNLGRPLIGRVLTFDALTTQWHEFSLKRSPDCPVCNQKTTFKTLHPIDTACIIPSKTPEISIEAFKTLKKNQTDFLLLDVREPDEYAKHNLKGQLIPLQQLPARLHELNPNQRIIIHCQSGVRSNQAGLILLRHGFKNVHQLKGGMTAFLASAASYCNGHNPAQFT